MNYDMMQTRAIKGLPSTVLIALWSCTQPQPIKELVYWCDSNDDDVRKACGLLERLGYVQADIRERGEKFYRIIDSAQELLPGFTRVLPAPVGENPEPGKSEPGTPVVLDAVEFVPVESPKAPESGNFGGKNAPGSGKSEPETGSINQINDDDESINLKTKSSSSIMNQDGRNLERVTEEIETVVFDAPAEFPTLEKLLESTDLLFGDHLDAAMFAPGLSPQLALAWICKAYFDAQKNPAFRNPLGLIRKRLQAREPRKISRLAEMPDEFLEAIGLWEGKCAYCAQGFRSRKLLNAHLLDGHRESAEDEGSLVADDLADVFPQWNAVLDMLREDMPRASFDTWVLDTRPVFWQDNKLVIGARNAYARDWLADRLTLGVVEALRKITGQDVVVAFEIMQ